MKIAAIDIGSNAARLLINEVIETKKGPAQYVKLNLLRIPLRLGMDVFSYGEIREERKAMLLDCMNIFASMMRMYEIDHYRACATSAMRDAKNGQELIETVKKNSGISIEIISGDEEASLIYENHIAETLDKNFGYLYIDVGGGSTELMYFEAGKLKYKKSFNIGTIRLLNGLVEEKQWKEMKEEIKTKIVSKKTLLGIGSGGNINKIFSLSRTKDSNPLSRVTLRNYHKELSPLSVEERMRKYNLREDRADVIVPALEIFNKVMSWSGITKIYVPKISVADGLIHNIYQKLDKEEKKCK